MDIVRRENPSTEMGYARDVDPFRMMRDLMRFDPFRDMGTFDFGRNRNYTPRFDVRETRDAYVFEADLPGVREDDVTISVTGNRLNVSGQREQENVQEGDNWYAAERSYGQFSRTFMLPDGVDFDNIHADMKEGVLRVHAPKRPEVQPRRIQLGQMGQGQIGTSGTYEKGGRYETGGRQGNVGNQGNQGNVGNQGNQGTTGGTPGSGGKGRVQ